MDIDRTKVDELYKSAPRLRLGGGLFYKDPVFGDEEHVSIIRKRKKRAVVALMASEWFAQHGPPDLQPLPIKYRARDSLKRGGAPHILAWYASSLEGKNYDVQLHPSFEDYACGVMASEYAPDFIKKDEELQKRFPPRALKGLGPGLSWVPPDPSPRVRQRRRRWH